MRQSSAQVVFMVVCIARQFGARNKKEAKKMYFGESRITILESRTEIDELH